VGSTKFFGAGPNVRRVKVRRVKVRKDGKKSDKPSFITSHYSSLW